MVDVSLPPSNTHEQRDETTFEISSVMAFPATRKLLAASEYDHCVKSNKKSVVCRFKCYKKISLVNLKKELVCEKCERIGKDNSIGYVYTDCTILNRHSLIDPLNLI